MQRGTYVIALSAEAVEGGLVVRGEPQPHDATGTLWPGEAPEGEDAPRLLLEAFLEPGLWERGWVVLVLPTGWISYRRLRFEFSDPKKIRQVLPFELENELLDGLGSYAYDAEIVPRAEGGADVHVYLVERDVLESCAATVEAHGLSLQRATTAAHALAQAQPAGGPSHFHVYSGTDEAFVVHVVEGRLHALQSIAPHPGELLADLKALGPGSPHDQLRALFRAETTPEAGPGPGGAGSEATTDATTGAAAEAGPEPTADEAAPADPREALRERLRERMEDVRTEVNRFLRINSGGEPFTVSRHGLFAEMLDWNAEDSGLTLRMPQGAWPGAQRTHFGVLEELLAEPRALTGRGLNFHRRVDTWVALARELRWPLVAAGVLLLLLAALGGTGYYLRAQALESRLAQVQQELRRTLAISGPITSVTVDSAMGRLQERLERLRAEHEAVAFVDSYHYNALKLLRALSGAVQQQPEVTVDAVSYNAERFTMSGTTPSYSASEGLKRRVQAMERFEDNPVQVTHSNAGQTIRYRLTVEL